MKAELKKGKVGEIVAFGITREELNEWKQKVKKGEIAYITHYWFDERFPDMKTVTKVGCGNLEKLIKWGNKHNIPLKYIDNRSGYPHFDLMGDHQINILRKENMLDQLERFRKKEKSEKTHKCDEPLVDC